MDIDGAALDEIANSRFSKIVYTMVTLTSGISNGVGVFGQRLLFVLPQGAVDSGPLPPAANSPVTTLRTGAPGPVDLMPCGTDACWLDEGVNAMMRIDPAGGSIAVMPLPTALSQPLDVAFDGADFYVIGSRSSGTTELLGRMTSDGSTSSIIATMPANGGGSVAVDDECVYWQKALGIFSLAKTAEGPFAQ